VLKSPDGLGAYLPCLLDSDMDHADVRILTADGHKLSAHSCVLSASPVLKSCLRLVDVRVSPDIVINIEFNQPTVQALLSFLYKGTTQLSISYKKEFAKLCKALRLNPTVLDEVESSLNCQQNETLLTPSDVSSLDLRQGYSNNTVPCPVGETGNPDPYSHLTPSIGFAHKKPSPSLSIGANKIERSAIDKSSQKQLSAVNCLTSADQSQSPRLRGLEIKGNCNNGDVDKSDLDHSGASLPELQQNVTLLEHQQSEAAERSGARCESRQELYRMAADKVCPVIEISLPQTENAGCTSDMATHSSDPISVPETPFFADVYSCTGSMREDKQEYSCIQAEKSAGGDTSCQTEAAPFETDVPTKENDVSYEETPECISDYLSELNKQHESLSIQKLTDDIGANVETRHQDGDLSTNNNLAVSQACLTGEYNEFTVGQLMSPSQMKSENEFRMPENFDIPQDYIQEIVPKKNIKVKIEESFASLGVPTPPMSSTQALDPSMKLSVMKNAITATSPIEQSTPQSAIELVTTYVSKQTSSKSTKSTKRHTSGDLKRNRKRQSYVSELFGEGSQESEGNNIPDTPKIRKEFETCGGTATTLTGRLSPVPGGSVEASPPNPQLLEVLQDKKERIKKRLMDTDSETGEKSQKEKKKKRKKMRSKSGSCSSLPKAGSSSAQSNTCCQSANTSHIKSSSHISQNNSSSHSKHTSQASQVSVKNSQKRKSSSKTKEVRLKAPFKFEDDDKWLVRDSYEDSPPSESDQRKKEKKKKKKKKHDRKPDEEDSSEEDDRRKRLDERKQKSGGDALSWMFKRAKVCVKYQEHGKESIVDKAIYKMNLIGDEDEESSGVEEELRQRKREETNSESELVRSRSSSPLRKKKKKKRKSKKSKKSDRHNQSSEEDRDRQEKFKRSFSWQGAESRDKAHPPTIQKSISTFGTNSFKIPKLSKTTTGQN